MDRFQLLLHIFPSRRSTFSFLKRKKKSMNNATLSDRGGGGGIGLLLLNGPCFLFCDSRTQTQNKTYRVLYQVMDLYLFFTSYFWPVLLLINATILAPKSAICFTLQMKLVRKNRYDYILHITITKSILYSKAESGGSLKNGMEWYMGIFSNCSVSTT